MKITKRIGGNETMVIANEKDVQKPIEITATVNLGSGALDRDKCKALGHTNIVSVSDVKKLAGGDERSRVQRQANH